MALLTHNIPFDWMDINDVYSISQLLHRPIYKWENMIGHDIYAQDSGGSRNLMAARVRVVPGSSSSHDGEYPTSWSRKYSDVLEIVPKHHINSYLGHSEAKPKCWGICWHVPQVAVSNQFSNSRIYFSFDYMTCAGEDYGDREAGPGSGRIKFDNTSTGPYRTAGAIEVFAGSAQYSMDASIGDDNNYLVTKSVCSTNGKWKTVSLEIPLDDSNIGYTSNWQHFGIIIHTFVDKINYNGPIFTEDVRVFIKNVKFTYKSQHNLEGELTVGNADTATFVDVENNYIINTVNASESVYGYVPKESSFGINGINASNIIEL